MPTNELKATAAGSSQVIAPLRVQQLAVAFEPEVSTTVTVDLDGERLDVSLTQADVDQLFRELTPLTLRLREFELVLVEEPTGDFTVTLRDARGDVHIVGQGNTWTVLHQLADDIEKHRLDDFLD